LDTSLIHQCPLKMGQLSILCDSLYGDNTGAVALGRKNQACGYRQTVKVDCACPAFTRIAASVYAHQTKVTSKDIQKSPPGVEVQLALVTVNVECN
jgi:hypothetical protein